MIPSMLPALFSVAARDLRIAARGKSDALNIVVFFVIVTSLFPLGVGTDAALLRAIAPGVVWIAALLASMLALTRLFASDHVDGTLEQLVLSPQPLGALMAAKIFAHWLVTGFPLVLLAPVLGLQFGLQPDAMLMLAVSLLLGTPVLSLLGAIAAALTLGLRGGNVLATLIVLPLCVPVLVFGASAVDATAAGLPASAQLSLLGACLLPAAFFGPWCTAAAVRIALE